MAPHGPIERTGFLERRVGEASASRKLGFSLQGINRGSRVSFAALNRPGHAWRNYISTLLLKPPQNMRLASKGIFFGSIILASRGSFITFFMMRSRSARDL